MVDEESVGSVDSHGCGAKILCGEGALEHYLSRQNLKEAEVCTSNSLSYIHYYSLDNANCTHSLLLVPLCPLVHESSKIF